MGNFCIKQLIYCPRYGIARGKLVLIIGGLYWHMGVRRHSRCATLYTT